MLLTSEKVSRAFLEACQKGTHPSYRARINIIGHSGAGKTSLTRRLLEQTFQKREDSTDGIETHRIEFDLNGSPQGNVAWVEADLQTDQLVRIFNNDVYKRIKEDPSRDKQNPLDKHINAKLGEVVNHEIIKELQNYAKERSDETEHKEKKNTKQTQQNGERSKFKDDEKQTRKKKTLLHRVKTLVLPKQAKGMSSEKYDAQGRQDRLTNDLDKGVLQLWDFGGQTEFYTTHHIFLELDAVNVIVMDISKPLKRKLANQSDDEKLLLDIPGTPEEFLCYWLRSIQVKAASERLEPTVLLVLTHKDKIQTAEEQNYTMSFVQDVQKLIEKKQLPAIPVDKIFLVNNKNGPDEDFRNLRKCVQQTIVKGPSWKSPRPIRWLKLEADMKQKIKEKCTAPLKHLTHKEVMKLSSVYHMEQEELEGCLLFLHSAGDLIWFPDDHLRDVIIVDPQWLVDVFKVLVTSEQFIRKKHLQDDAFQLIKHGIVSFSGLEKFWAGNDVKFLVELMKKFDLLLPVGSESLGLFLVPSMLPARHMPLQTIAGMKNCKSVYSTQHLAEFEELFPIGTFAKLLAAANKIWPICEDIELVHNFAMLLPSDDTLLELYQPHRSTIEISLWCIPEKLERHPLPLVLKVRAALATILKTHGIHQSDMCEIVCPNWRPHYALFCTTKALQKSLDPNSGFDSIQYFGGECLCPNICFGETN